MNNITWGEPIEAGSPGYPVKGEAPAWVADDDQVKPCFARDGEYPSHVRASSVMWHLAVSFRLPADHWAYAPIAAGYTPWAGGENAPDDWDGWNVLHRDGERATGRAWEWSVPQHRDAGPMPGDIIGYKRDSRWLGSMYHRPELQQFYDTDLVHRYPVAFKQTATSFHPWPDDSYIKAKRILERLILRSGAIVEPAATLDGVLDQIESIVDKHQCNDGSTLDIANKIVAKLNGPDRPPYPYFPSVGDAMNAIDGLIAQMTRIEPGDWYRPHDGAEPLHVPTIKACINALASGFQPGAHLLEQLLPPDPLTERAKQLHAAAKAAHFRTPTPDAPSNAFGDWDKLSDALRKFWIAMARIDGERGG